MTRDCRQRRIPGWLAPCLVLTACATTESGPSDGHADGRDDVEAATEVEAPETGDDASIDAACPAGTISCPEGCVDPTSDAENCGACGHVCPAGFEHTMGVCLESACYLRCLPGWVDIDGEPGCENPCTGSGIESCNGVDDDCDGETDEDFDCAAGAPVACTTACGSTGTGTCSVECRLPATADCTPPVEACNGLDDDCDGETDEEQACVPGEALACTTTCRTAGTGVCSDLCLPPTAAECVPPAETCNGLDDDCDGTADDGFPCLAGSAVSCTTRCGSVGTGVCSPLCELPTPASCTPPLEACNGRDDDCDGITDEELPCRPGETLPCTTTCGTVGTGICSVLCELPTPAACTPPAESCNRIDDDCDGATDETFPCVAGELVSCPTSCGTSGSGTCTSTCALPTGTACTPPADVCNAIDDDCDGATDESFPCIAGRTVSCTTACGTPGTGLCSATCALPTGTACSGPAETCNALDDDCDGLTDETFACIRGATVSCATTCGSTGTGTCSSTCALPPPASCTPPAETCNGVDEDCDGATDEGWPCAAGATVACTTTCGSTGSGVCTAACALPTGAACALPAETCNAVDDDCDTRIDEGLAGCPTCTPDCVGRECGDDGCGGTCGTCTAPRVCGPAGRCICPIQGCTTGSESRDRCSGARTIGRTSAASSGGYRISDRTCYAYNRFDGSDSCWDAGADHAYKVFLRTGERIDITVDQGWGCVDTWWDTTIQIWTNSGCTDTACTTKTFCEDYVDDPFNHAYVASYDGWVILVVDGTTAFDDEGNYDLTVRLTCLTSGCEC
ncbi:MAG: hypothetical protein JXB32_10040 [Deltaproteobacteria bacterium]|nr:hypothetical protein [Deltaproteobacteria bacterium]